jgi:hypothetical protein
MKVAELTWVGGVRWQSVVNTKWTCSMRWKRMCSLKFRITFVISREFKINMDTYLRAVYHRQ